MPKIGKSSSPFSWKFDCLGNLPFDSVASVGAAAANTTVQARVVVPQRLKIAKIVANYSAIGSGGAHSINIVVGNGAEGASITTGVDPLAVAGTMVFTADTDISVAGADVPTQLVASFFDVIYNTGALLTLRCVTPATTGSFTNLKVALLVAYLDPFPQLQVKGPAVGTAAAVGSTPVQTTGW